MSIKRITGWPGMAAGTAAVVAVAAALGGGAAAAGTRPGIPPSTAGTISTVAGGVGGPARATTVDLAASGPTQRGPCGLASAPGHLYVADTNAVRSIEPSTDQLTTPAGTGLPGSLHTRGPSVQANGLDTCSVAVDGAGNLVMADPSHHQILVAAQATGSFYGQAMTAGHLYSVAGDGTKGFSGDGGPATSARLAFPGGVAVDAAGNLVIADTANSRIRVVAEHTGTFYGQAMTAGDIYTIAGDGTDGFAGDGGPATAAELGVPPAVALDSAGNVLIDDGSDTFSPAEGNDRIRVVAEHTGSFYGQAMTAGHIYTIAGDGKNGFSGDGGPATSAELSDPGDVTTDGAGNLVIADIFNLRIRVVAASTGTFYGQAMTAGDIYTVAGNGKGGDSGDGGPATSAEFETPDSVLVGGGGNLIIGDQDAGEVRVVAEHTGTFYGQAMTAGDIYRVAGTVNTPFLFSGDGGPATSAQADLPEGVAVDAAGNVLLADYLNQRIRVLAKHTGTFYGHAMTAGHIYTIAGGGTSDPGNGGPATKALVDHSAGVTLDAAGNVLITETAANRIRVVAEHTGTFYGQAMTAGDIYLIAGGGTNGLGDGGPATSAELNTPAKAAVDGAGNVLIADWGNDRVRLVAEHTGEFYGQAMTAGDIYTIAGNGTLGTSGDGGPATSASVSDPAGVAVDGHGNVLISTAFTGGLIRAVAATTGTFYGQAMTAGDIYTIAGGGTNGIGDGGPATSAQLGEPKGIAVDSSGNVLFADALAGRILVVAERSGTFYGRAMTPGNIYSVAGFSSWPFNGPGGPGFSGDGGPATKAVLNTPEDVAPAGSGLVIADAANNRIRMVAG